jgi:hypothetical protein
MSKAPNNNDFEELFHLYTESSCNFDKKVEDDEEEKDEEETLKEKEEVDEEEDEETLEEGMYDRVKARAAGVKDAAGSYMKGLGSALKGGAAEGGVSNKYNSAKTQSIINSHVKKIDAALSGFATDLVKLGLVDEDQAEKIAGRASNIVRANPTVANVIKRSK